MLLLRPPCSQSFSTAPSPGPPSRNSSAPLFLTLQCFLFWSPTQLSPPPSLLVLANLVSSRDLKYTAADLSVSFPLQNHLLRVFLWKHNQGILISSLILSSSIDVFVFPPFHLLQGGFGFFTEPVTEFFRVAEGQNQLEPQSPAEIIITFCLQSVIGVVANFSDVVGCALNRQTTVQVDRRGIARRNGVRPASSASYGMRMRIITRPVSPLYTMVCLALRARAHGP